MRATSMSMLSSSDFATDEDNRTTGVTGPALLAVVLFAFGGCAAKKDSWLEVGIATDGTRAFIDQKSLEMHGARIAGRQSFLLARPGPSGVMRVEQQVIYDCARGRVFTSRSLEFDRAGNVKRRDILSPPAEDVVQPGILPHYIYEVLC